MLVRYKTSATGSPVKQAHIFTYAEHRIPKANIDADALKIAARLRAAGHSTYIVGGAVRDLILGKRPKDFDIVTDATPGRIRKLFRNSRVIGRRFRLVHVFFQDKIVEVSTFRSEESGGFMNIFGEIEEDAKRRDFTANALFYDPEEQTILDYVGGFDDLKAKRLRPIIPLDRIFSEDPVRMIRAVKYSVAGGLKVGFMLRQQMRRSVWELAQCPPSRMTEELFKILGSGCSADIVLQCERYAMLPLMLPAVGQMIKDSRTARDAFLRMLGLLDGLVREGEQRKARMLAYLCAAYLFHVSPYSEAERIPFREAFSELKTFIRPMLPANKDLEQALVHLIRRRKIYRELGTLERSPDQKPSGRKSQGSKSADQRSPGQRSSSERSPGQRSPGQRPPGQRSPGQRSPGRRSQDGARGSENPRAPRESGRRSQDEGADEDRVEEERAAESGEGGGRAVTPNADGDRADGDHADGDHADGDHADGGSEERSAEADRVDGPDEVADEDREKERPSQDSPRRSDDW